MDFRIVSNAIVIWKAQHPLLVTIMESVDVKRILVELNAMIVPLVILIFQTVSSADAIGVVQLDYLATTPEIAYAKKDLKVKNVTNARKVIITFLIVKVSE